MDNKVLIFLGCLLLISCDLNRTAQIYNPGFIVEKYYDIPLGWEVENGEPISFNKVIDTISNNYKPKLIAFETSTPVLKQRITLFDSGSYFIVGKFKAEIDTGLFYVNISSEETTKEIVYNKTTDICLRALFSVQITKRADFKLEIGFKPGSIGTAEPEVLYISNEYYFDELNFDTRPVKNGIKRISGINDFDSVNFDMNIDKIAESIAKTFLVKNDSLLHFYSSDIFKNDHTRYLHIYASNGGEGESASQMCSLSLDEILKIYRIPVRQLSWQHNCSGIHQFIEYWNPYERHWKIIDPYFGIRYVNEANNYLCFEEVEMLLRDDAFKNLEIERVTKSGADFTISGIKEGWESNELAVFITRK